MRRLARHALRESRIDNAPLTPARSNICIFCQHQPSSHLLPVTSAFSTSTPRPSAQEPATANAASEKPSDVDVAPASQDQSLEPPMTLKERRELQRARTREADAWNREMQLRQTQSKRDRKRNLQAKVDRAATATDIPRAKTWNDLQMIGGEKEFDTGEKFVGFLSKQKIKSQVGVTAAIYRAVVEVFAAIAAGKDPKPRPDYVVGELLNATQHVRVEVTRANDPEGAGAVKLIYPEASVEEDVLNAGVTEGDTAITASPSDELSPARIDEDQEALELAIKSWGTAWHHISLHDPDTKLAIISRLTRLTGRTFSDHGIHNSSKVAQLVSELAKPDPPTKVFDAVSADGTLPGLPNVEVLGRKYTYIDKERQIGRWKVIEQELRRRRLPVY